jgi:hypothetical protein
MPVGQAPDIRLGDGIPTAANQFEPVDRPLETDYVSTLAFMEEPIEILVHETSDENAENPVIVGNNGVFKAFFRGQPTIAKRKFVDSLIVKTGRVTTPEYINNGGERARAIRQHSAHKYPFSVLKDSNPKGAEWLRQRMADVI